MKRILIILALLAVIGAGVGYLMYNKPHQDISATESDVTKDAKELFAEFENDESKAEQNYLDKIVAVKGVVKSIDESNTESMKLILDSGNDLFGVICELDALTKHKRTDFKVGESVALKGICTGKLMDVVLVRCVEL